MVFCSVVVRCEDKRAAPKRTNPDAGEVFESRIEPNVFFYVFEAPFVHSDLELTMVSQTNMVGSSQSSHDELVQ